MILMPIVYVSDMQTSVTFYERLGFAVDQRSRSGIWTELSAGDAILALHAHETLPPAQPERVELSFVAEEPLEQLAERLRASEVELVRGITDENFGRSLVIRDPDGLALQINEHDRELYT